MRIHKTNLFMKMPENSVYVGRPSQWGNPAKIGGWFKIDFSINRKSVFKTGEHIPVVNNPVAVALFYEYCISRFESDPVEFRNWLRPLVGKILCCWCKLEEVCHADVLLYLTSLFVEGEFIKPDRWPTLNEIIHSKSTG